MLFRSSGIQGSNIASSSILPAPMFQPLLPLIPGTSGLTWNDSDQNMKFLNSNMVKTMTSPYLNLPKKTNMGLTPSPEVLQLVASCVASGQHLSSSVGTTSSSIPESKLLLPESIDQAGCSDAQGAEDKSKDMQSLPPDTQGKLPEEKPGQPDSGDSSKTRLDASQTEQPDVEEDRKSVV